MGASNPLYAGKALTSGTGNIVVTTPGHQRRRQLRFAARNPGRGCARAGALWRRETMPCLPTFPAAQPAQIKVALSPTPRLRCSTTAWRFQAIFPARLLAGKSGVELECGFQQRSGRRPGLDGERSHRTWSRCRDQPPGVDLHQLRRACGLDPLWLSCYSAMAPSVFYDQGAFLLAVKPNADGGLRTNLKGRMNFSTLGSGPGHIITLSDSNFQKTIATANNGGE